MARKARKIALTLDDVAEARDAFRRDAEPRYKTLLDAQPVETKIDAHKRKTAPGVKRPDKTPNG